MCINFSVVVIPSFVQIHHFEFLLPFFLGFIQMRLSTGPPFNSTKMPPVKDTSDTHITRFNVEFSILLLNCQHHMMQLSFFKLFKLDSLGFPFPWLLASSQTPLQVPSHLPIIGVLLCGLFYRSLFIYSHSLGTLKTISPLMTLIFLSLDIFIHLLS